MGQFLGPNAGNDFKGVTKVFRPNSTLVTQIQTWLAAGTAVEGMLLSIDTSTGNWYCKKAVNDQEVELRVIRCNEDSDWTYKLTCEIHAAIDAEGNFISNPSVISYEYGTSTIALGNQIQKNGATDQYVEGVASGGRGLVVAKDDPTGTVQVLS